MMEKEKTYKLGDLENYPIYHKEMWEWLSDRFECSKEDWFNTFWKDSVRPQCLCFACDYAHYYAEDKGYCPLIGKVCNIGDFSTEEECLDGLFDNWCSAETQDESKQFCIEIANKRWCSEVGDNDD